MALKSSKNEAAAAKWADEVAAAIDKHQGIWIVYALARLHDEHLFILEGQIERDLKNIFNLVLSNSSSIDTSRLYNETVKLYIKNMATNGDTADDIDYIYENLYEMTELKGPQHKPVSDNILSLPSLINTVEEIIKEMIEEYKQTGRPRSVEPTGWNHKYFIQAMNYFNYNKTDFAKYLNVSPRTIDRFSHKTHFPSEEQFKKIMELLGKENEITSIIIFNFMKRVLSFMILLVLIDCSLKYII